MSSSDAAQAHSLLTAAAVRERAHEMLAIGTAGGLEHWRVDLDRLPETARYVAAVIRDQYPTLAVPFHESGSDPDERERPVAGGGTSELPLEAHRPGEGEGQEQPHHDLSPVGLDPEQGGSRAGQVRGEDGDRHRA